MEWIEFLTANQIPYVTSGPNTRKGEISIKCPYCGDDDPSEHLGISLSKAAWGCHRDQSHRGKHPLRLIRALLGCSTTHAKLVLQQFDSADPDDLEGLLTALNNEAAPVTKPKPEELKLSDEFLDIGAPLTERFQGYLLQRGFYRPKDLTKRYGLCCALTGKWKNRIIIPIYHKKVLTAWTARAIQKPRNAPRYLSTSGAIKNTVYNYDTLMKGGEILFVTEGPFDALKVDYFGAALGVRATAVFGTSIVPEQFYLLKDVAKKFSKVVFLLDTDAIEATFQSSDWIPNAAIGLLPFGVKDPGDLSERQVKDLINQH